MKDLKEFAINNIVDNLSEGILDDIDSTIAAADQYMDEQMLADWSKRSRTPAHWWKKKVGFTLQGDYNISGIETKEYHGPQIRLCKGNITISNTQLETLEGIFKDGCVIEGTLTIENNPNLTSLKGVPTAVNTFMVMDNKNLKDIDYAPEVKVNVYAMRNGKKFNKEKLAEKIVVGKHIFCSQIVDTELVNEEQLNEAFKVPQLAMFVDAMNKIQVDDRNSRKTISDLLGEVQWDKIDNSHIAEYDARSKEAEKAARIYITGKRRGAILLMNEAGEITGFIKGKTYVELVLNQWSSKKDKWSRWGYEYKVDHLLYHISRADTIITIDYSNDADYSGNIYNDEKNIYFTQAMKSARKANRSGATALMRDVERDTSRVTAERVRYYQDIADENRRRYKKMLTIIKANKAMQTNKFDKIKDRVDKCFDRYTALIAKILKNPTKYTSYDLDWLNDKFINVHASKHTYHESGLMISFERYVRYMMEISRGNDYSYGPRTEERIKEYETKMEDELLKVEHKLTELEAK